MIGNFIKNLRQKNKLSQSFLAKKLGITRPTYMQIENGGRDIALGEIKILADFFGFSVSDFIGEKMTNESKTKEDEPNQKKDILSTTQNMQIRVFKKNIKKFKEVLLYILGKVGAKPNIGETAIYKLLYFIDFDYFEKYDEQLMGLTYIKNYHGPTPVEFKKVVEKMQKDGEIEVVKSKYYKYTQKKYLPLRRPKLSELSAQELSLINDVLAKLSDKNAKELSEYSHKDIPWAVHKKGETIDYMFALYRNDEYSVRDYEPL